MKRRIRKYKKPCLYPIFRHLPNSFNDCDAIFRLCDTRVRFMWHNFFPVQRSCLGIYWLHLVPLSVCQSVPSVDGMVSGVWLKCALSGISLSNLIRTFPMSLCGSLLIFVVKCQILPFLSVKYPLTMNWAALTELITVYTTAFLGTCGKNLYNLIIIVAISMYISAWALL